MPSKPLRDLELGNEPGEIINTAEPAESTKNDAKGKKTIVIIAINLLTLALITIFSSKFFGKNVLLSGWYWIAIFAITIIGLIAWTEGNVSTKIAKKISISFCAIAFLMTAVTSIWPNFNVEELKKHENKNIAESPVCVEISRGWTIDAEGRLVANLQQGEEANRPFHLEESQSTPWIIIPEDNYRFRFTNLQTIIVDERCEKTVVHPQDYYDMRITTGSRKLRFTALKGGAEIILHIKRL